MTQPPQSFIDTGNPLLAEVPLRLDTGIVGSPAGNLGVVTIRSATTTLTAFLSAEDLRDWVKLFTGLADQLSRGNASLVQASPMDVAALARQKPNGKG